MVGLKLIHVIKKQALKVRVPFKINYVPYCIEAKWRIYASVHQVNTGSDSDLSPVRRQAMIWISARILLIGHILVKVESLVSASMC